MSGSFQTLIARTSSLPIVKLSSCAFAFAAVSRLALAAAELGAPEVGADELGTPWLGAAELGVLADPAWACDQQTIDAKTLSESNANLIRLESALFIKNVEISTTAQLTLPLRFSFSR